MTSNIKFIELKGALPGKRVVVLAGVHGNEACGVNAFDSLLPQLKLTAGSALFIYANLEAIKQNKRFVESNLNRCFFPNQPSDILNTLEGRTAREIMPFLDKADALLDIHASTTPKSVPFIICDERWIDNASIFDTSLVSFNWDPFEPGSTDYYMNLQKRPAFCIECGYLENPDSTKIAINAINNFLIYNGNIKGKILSRKKQKKVKIVGIYKNKNAPFKASRYFRDFELLTERTIIGTEGIKKVYCKPGQIVLFVRDRKELNQECFLLAENV